MSSSHIRVFLSSPFKDVQGERDILVRQIFPDLRRRLARAGISMTEIDLRWGITEGQSEAGLIVPRCFDEIDNSYPFFIGFFGERYGTPLGRLIENRGLPDSFYSEHPWINEAMEMSVTELEIEYGVLRFPKGQKIRPEHTAFYFRTRDVDELDPGIDQLKNRLRSENLPVRDGYSSSEEFGDMVNADLEAFLDRVFPGWQNGRTESQVQDRQRMTSSRLCLSDAETLSSLEACSQKPLPTLLRANMGEGATTILASWFDRVVSSQKSGTVLISGDPADPTRDSDFDFGFFRTINATEESSIWQSVIWELISSLDKVLGNPPMEISSNSFSQIRNSLTRLMEQLQASNYRYLIILDGVDRFENIDKNDLFFWVPANIPPNVKLVFSGGKEASRQCELLNWEILSLPQWDSRNRNTYIVQEMHSFGKSLEDSLLRAMVEASRGYTPLEIHVALSALRANGVSSGLDSLVEEFRTSDVWTVRWNQIQSSFSPSQMEMVETILAAIHASRFGLSESEVKEVCRPLFPEDSFSLYFCGAFSSVLPWLKPVGALYHIRSEAPQPHSADTDVTDELIQYFQNCDTDARVVDELPHLLLGKLSREPDALPELHGLFSDFGLLGIWANRRIEDLLGVASSLIGMVGEYCLEFPAIPGELSPIEWDGLWALCQIRLSCGEVEDTIEVVHLGVEQSRGTPASLKWLLLRVELLKIFGNGQEAITCLSEIENISQSKEDHYHQILGLIDRAALRFESCDFDGGRKDLNQASEIASRYGDLLHMAQIAIHQAYLAGEEEDYPEAERLLEEATSLSKRIGWLDGERQAVGNLAVVYARQAKNDWALKCHDRELALATQAGDVRSQILSFSRLGAVYQHRADHDRAFEFLNSAEQIARQSPERKLLAQILVQMAVLLGEGLDQPDLAVSTLNEAAEISLELQFQDLMEEIRIIMTRWSNHGT